MPIQLRSVAGAVALAMVAGACSEAAIDISNPNVAQLTTVAGDPTAIQLMATGLIADQRGSMWPARQVFGIHGRESFNFTTTEGRNTTNYIVGILVNGVQKLDYASTFASPNAVWFTQYNVLRDIDNFKRTVNASAGLSANQKAGALGFAQTLEALMLFELIQAHDSTGLPVEVKENGFELAPFVTRDSVYKHIIGLLDDASTKLLVQSDTTFRFTLTPGFSTAIAGADFTRRSVFNQFNRALKAKVAAHYATLGGGASAWQAALAALGQSFLNASATTRAQLDVGPVVTYAPAPDTPNPASSATNSNLYAHPSILADVQKKANGANDDRYTAKIRTGLPAREGPRTADGPTSATSTLGFSLYPTTSTPIAIIRNEELILLRAEARLATGDKAGAIADLNVVRVSSGGLPASTLTTASTNDQILDGILYEKRYSLLLEGNRWVDMRRYNRLSQLPLDVASGPNKNFVAKVIPIPQAECLIRQPLGAAFLGPNGQNNCTP